MPGEVSDKLRVPEDPYLLNGILQRLMSTAIDAQLLRAYRHLQFNRVGG